MSLHINCDLVNIEQIELKNQLSPTVSYLQQEIIHLEEKIFDLEETLKITKNSLKISLNLHQKKDNNDSLSSIKKIIEGYEEESNKGKQNIKKLSKQSDFYMSKCLINEQIIQQTQKRGLELESEFEEKFRYLQNTLKEKEQIIRELEKKIPELENEGVIIKYREILTPTKQAIVMQNELNHLKNILTLTLKEITKLNEEKQELLTINFTITNELNQLKLGNGQFSKSVSENIDQTEAILDHHHSIDSLPSQKDEISPENSPLPDKVQRISQGPSPSNLKKIHVSIPKLDLTQAKKIQEYNAKRSTQALVNNQNADQKLLDKIQSLETENEKIKNFLSKEMCKNNLFKEKMDELKLVINELEAKNNVLLNALNFTEDKLEKLKKEMNFFKDYYEKSIKKNKVYELSKSFSKSSFDEIIPFEKKDKKIALLNFSDDLDKKLLSYHKKDIDEEKI